MIRRTFFVAALLAAAATACSDTTVVESPPSPNAVAPAQIGSASFAKTPTRYLVVFAKSAPAGFEAAVADLGGAVLLNHAIGVAVVEGLDDTTAAELQKRVHAQYVVQDAEFRLLEPAAVTTVEELGTEPASPTDPTTAAYYSMQWNMRQIHAPEAWAAGRLGSSSVSVAILDTGIDYLLPDLVGRVDLSRSASFEPIDDQLVQIYFPGRNPTTDLHFHGTNVATQVASNAAAFAGVTSQTTLMSVKVCSVVGGCHGVYQGILFAIDHGADVINMSLGGWFRKSAYPGEVAAYNRLMNYAKQKGVTIVVAAGNDANDLDTQKNIYVGNGVRTHIPSFFATYCDATHVICVAATRLDDAPASYTNYGRSAIDVAAPGGDYGEWIWSLCPQTSLIVQCLAIGVAGTSQATPHVSGLAALAVEDVGRSPAQVRAYIRNSADPIGGGNTPYYGKGRINVARAVGAN